MASSEEEQTDDWLKNSLLDVTSPDNNLMQNFKKSLISHSEKINGLISRLKELEDGFKVDGLMSRVKELEDGLKVTQSEKVDGLVSRVKNLEDELKVAQSEIERVAMNSKQIKEELTKQSKEHHETIKREIHKCNDEVSKAAETIKHYLEKEILKCRNEMRQADNDLAKQITSAEENFIASVDILSANQQKEVKTTREMNEEIENIKEDYIEKFTALQEDVKAINRGIKRNQEDFKVIKEQFQVLQTRTTVTEGKLLSIQNRTIVLILCIVVLTVACNWVFSIIAKLFL